MSISSRVDEAYRLHVKDLEGKPRRVVIANVTVQGLEQSSPVLHFAGQSKRLVLTPDQVRQVIALTGTTLFADWIGASLVLEPARAGGERVIIIAPPTRPAHAMPVPRSDDQRGWRLAWRVVGLIALASTVYWLATLPWIPAWLARYLP